ncbi:hypothetical protein SVIO_006130 [Streptomyces violaceusniger]|uniref:Uncharacterized protein n=1 Tax=Streptomyces violaceusniger TaxID=68280 RepID=A0A4D4KTU6_STRVO|nr:hypothetical protein SVIO_006130 [Streptomyces violaceusniger]
MPETGSGMIPEGSARSAGLLASAVDSSAAGSSSGGCSAGAASRMTWALVPLMPNEDTPARRGWSFSGQSMRSVSSLTFPAVQSTCVLGRVTCRVSGRTPSRMAMTILMTPPTPAAACACPMLDFNDPSHSGRSSGRSRP